MIVCPGISCIRAHHCCTKSKLMRPSTVPRMLSKTMKNKTEQLQDGALATCTADWTASSLLLKTESWSECTDSEWDLRTLSKCYRLQFAVRPPQVRGIAQSETLGEAALILPKAITSLIEKGAIRQVPHRLFFLQDISWFTRKVEHGMKKNAGSGRWHSSPVFLLCRPLVYYDQSQGCLFLPLSQAVSQVCLSGN